MITVVLRAPSQDQATAYRVSRYESNAVANCSQRKCASFGYGPRPMKQEARAATRLVIASLICLGASASAGRAWAFDGGSIGVGHYFSCGLRPDGSAVCWGDNTFGESAPPAGPFSQISVGVSHACALRHDGTAVCWGENSLGQTAAPAGTFQQIAAGYRATCALDAGGNPVCWGGVGAPPAHPLEQVSAGYGAACGVDAGGVLSCWGSDPYLGSTLPAGTFTSVSVDDTHACALTTSGSFICWAASSPPVPPTGTFVRVSAGGGLNGGTNFGDCGLHADGTIACTAGAPTPPAGTFVQLAMEETHACAIRADASVRAGESPKPTARARHPPG